MRSIPDIILRCRPGERALLMGALPDEIAEAGNRAFAEWAHGGQVAPAGDWRTWVLMAGRGFGKTRAGAEWVLDGVRGSARPQGEAGGGERRIALVAATVDEVRRVMVEGPSGILACARPDEILDWVPSRGELMFRSGAVATLFSGANPESLRGPQHHLAWCDELAKWRHPGATWDMLQLGLRCGERPRALVTTTPRGGCEALKRILTAEDTVLTGGTSRGNPHLPAAFLRAVEAAYGGTRMGREELDGELLDDVHGSLWPLALLERSRGAAPAADALRRVVIGVDPPASAGGTCGIVACGLDGDGVGWVLADHSEGGLSPEGWARKVAMACELHGADRIVAETNQGGDMVRSVLRAAGIVLPVTPATASKGKGARAEPVAGLFESGKARLAGRFAELEAQLGGLVPEGYAGTGGSPDRADAMVWALWALLLAPQAEPRVRVI
jgi:phage terminase large subunit-like protein